MLLANLVSAASALLMHAAGGATAPMVWLVVAANGFCIGALTSQMVARIDD